MLRGGSRVGRSAGSPGPARRRTGSTNPAPARAGRTRPRPPRTRTIRPSHRATGSEARTHCRTPAIASSGSQPTSSPTGRSMWVSHVDLHDPGRALGAFEVPPGPVDGVGHACQQHRALLGRAPWCRSGPSTAIGAVGRLVRITGSRVRPAAPRGPGPSVRPTARVGTRVPEGATGDVDDPGVLAPAPLGRVHDERPFPAGDPGQATTRHVGAVGPEQCEGAEIDVARGDAPVAEGRGGRQREDGLRDPAARIAGRSASATSCSSLGVAWEPTSDPVSARLVGRLDDQSAEIGEHESSDSPSPQRSVGHRGQDGLLAEVEADEIGYVGVDLLVVGDPGARRVDERNPPGSPRPHEPGDPEERVRVGRPPGRGRGRRSACRRRRPVGGRRPCGRRPRRRRGRPGRRPRQARRPAAGRGRRARSRRRCGHPA